MNVPFFRPSITDAEIDGVVACLKSGWLTTGPRTKEFEAMFVEAVGAKHALALNSCTAALHLAVDALGLQQGQAVLVPTMTFAATAEVVRYMGAVPVPIDCDPVTLNMDLADAARKIDDLAAGRTPLDPSLKVVGIMPVHVGGLMMDMEEVRAFAEGHGLWVVEDAAHALPAAYRVVEELPLPFGRGAGGEGKAVSSPLTEGPHPNPLPKREGTWRRCGENTAAVTCFSFYANKTITTGEGGMAVTDDDALADRMKQMSLHGLSHDAWKRYSGGHAWDYRIVAPGYKYNFTDIAAAIGIEQLKRAEELRIERATIAHRFHDEFQSVEQIELPPDPPNRIHSWHLFPIRLCLEHLKIDRNAFIDEMRARGVGCSVHWRPLHLHPYYEEVFHWRPEHLPTATATWERLISLPLFPGMTDDEQSYVVRVVGDLCRENAK